MTTTAPRTSRAGRRWRAPVIWTTLLLLVSVLTALASLRQAGNTDANDPQNPGRRGAQALTEVLRNRGVQVQVVRSEQALRTVRIAPDTTLLVTATDRLSGTMARRVLTRARDAGRIVLLTPPQTALDGMGLPLDAVKHTTYQQLTAGCSSPDVRPGEHLAGGEVRYAPRSGSGATVCFPPGPGFAGGDQPAGYYVTLPAQASRPAVAVLGSVAAIANDSVTDADHAALALRSLGHSPRLVWYVASLADVAADDDSAPPPLLPGWFLPALAVVGTAVLTLMISRGRRLGRLVTEPLPVVVRAIETTESRGRLYRRAEDRGRAVAVLQGATRRRLTGYLGLSPGTTPPDLADAVADATGRHTDEVLGLLTAPVEPADDALLHTAGQLAELEEDVRR